MNTDLLFTKAADALQLGNIVCKATKVQGGLMHTMYKLQTDKNSFAIKLLNPNIMLRNDALGNFAQAETLEAMLENNNIPIVAALVFDGKKMQQIDGQYFYLYQWYDGKIINNASITKRHCVKISNALQSIHSIDTKSEANNRTPININWQYYIECAKTQDSCIYSAINDNISTLCERQDKGNASLQNIPLIVSVCHNDMDCKNVLWQGDDFKIIDLECLGYANPYEELFELALCWLGFDGGSVDFELFYTFIKTYFSSKIVPDIDWQAIYYSNNGRLEWLEYNVKRALLIECDTKDEQNIGIAEVDKTIKQILYYNSIQNEILSAISHAIAQ